MPPVVAKHSATFTPQRIPAALVGSTFSAQWLHWHTSTYALSDSVCRYKLNLVRAPVPLSNRQPIWFCVVPLQVRAGDPRRGARQPNCDSTIHKAMSAVQGADREEQWLQSHDLPELWPRLVLDMRAKMWWRRIPHSLCVVEHFWLSRDTNARYLPALELLWTVWPAMWAALVQALDSAGGVSTCSRGPGGGRCVPSRTGNIGSGGLLLLPGRLRT